MKLLRKYTNKITVVLIPLLALFFIINSNGRPSERSQANFNNAEIIQISIDKYTTDNDISKIMASLKEKDIIASFKNISRNENNEITNIKIELTKNGATSRYNANSNMGIRTIIISIDGDFIQIYNKDGGFFRSNRPEDNISQLMQQFNAINPMQQSFFNTDEMDLLKKMMQRQQSLFNMEDSFFTDDQEDFNKEDYNYKKSTKSTYIVNGQEMTQEAYEKMDKSQIKSLEIKKETVQSYTK